MRKITVLQILPALDSGGVERGTLELGAYLVRQGHRSLVMSAGGRLLPQLLAEGSEHFTWAIGKKSLLTLRFIVKLRQFLREQQVDILHVRSRFPAWVAYLAWRGMCPQTRPILITTVHGNYSVNAYSQVMTKGEHVIVISSMIQDYAQKNYQLPTEKMTRIYRGVDTLKYSPDFHADEAWLNAWYQAYPHTKNKHLLTLPARVTRWKGQEDFIRILAFVRQHRQDVHGLIVGEIKEDKSDFAAQLKQQIANAGLENCVTFTGHRSDVKEIMSISKIVYSLSTAPEAFGRTTIEALSLGVPVIGYNHGGVAEQLAELLPVGAVEVGNIAEAAILTLNWLKAPPTIAPNTQFTLHNMLEKTVNVYNNMLMQAGR